MIDDKKLDMTRNVRDSETHDKEARRKPWRPVRKLETPPPPEGFVYRWIREATLGIEDANNMSYRLREGWELVQGSELPAGWHFPTIEQGRMAGVIHNEGLVLAKMPIETVNERREHYEDRTRLANEALDNTMFNDSGKDNRYVKYDSKRESQVTFGKKSN